MIQGLSPASCELDPSQLERLAEAEMDDPAATAPPEMVEEDMGHNKQTSCWV